MLTTRIFFLFIYLLTASAGFAQMVRGHISDLSGAAIPFVSVYVKNSTYGVSGNQKGDYLLQLKAGTHTLVYSLVGFTKEERTLTIRQGETQNLDVVLSEQTELMPLEIYSDTRDIAREVVGEARERRAAYREKVQDLSFRTYMKISLEKEFPDDSASKARLNDTLLGRAEAMEDVFKREHLNLIESLSEVRRSVNDIYEYVQGYHDYAETRPQRDIESSTGFQYGENDVARTAEPYRNPYLLDSRNAFLEYDFYSTYIDVPILTENKLMSPIGQGSALNYTYDLVSTFYENGRKIYQIAVKPLFKTEALFKGTIFIEDSSFALTAVDLEVNPAALFFYRDFRIMQNYRQEKPGVYLPYRREFIYTTREGKTTYHGATRCVHTEFTLNPEFERGSFGNEVQRYHDKAFDRDSLYWAENRSIAMKEAELEYIHRCDSLRAYYASEKYNHERDSAYNRITFWDVTLSGIGYRNREKNYSFYINPLLAQMIFFGIGGYRHRLGGSFTKDFFNARILELEGDIDYGFANKDVKGKLGVGYTYIPKKFVRTFIRAGDFYEMINTYASLGSVFSRSNFVRSQTISIAQRMEVVNGLFAEVTLDFSDQKPISNLKQDLWSQTVFGDVNQPIDFERYIKTEIRLDAKYRFRQKYIIKRNKKIILGSKWPELSFVYRKGISGLFGSEVNYDYLEFGIRDDFEPARLGTGEWSVLCGSFVNQKSLRILEHRYFRGSDVFFFSDPTRSFQLLGPTLSTANAFIRGNFVHHFNGLLLNKIPLINRLKLAEAAGAGFLMIPEKQFAHSEFFVGLMRPVRIRQQLFRFGIFAVTADNSFSKLRLTWKFGFQFFNTYSRKWSYI